VAYRSEMTDHVQGDARGNRLCLDGEDLVAETLKKGTRVTGAERNKLAAELKKKYDAGQSIRSLASATGRSYGFIHRILSESGANLRGRGGATRSRARA
jgi:hypothetical protein